MKVLNQYVLVFAWLFLFAGCSKNSLTLAEGNTDETKQGLSEELKEV